MAGRLSRGRRAARAVGLLLAVTLVHLWLADRVAESRLGEGAADTRPKRIEVAFVRVLVPEAPPPAPPAPRPAPKRRAVAAVTPAPAASAPAPAEVAMAPPPSPETVPSPLPETASTPTPEPVVAQAPEPASAPDTAVAAAPPASAPALAASAPAAFEWPPSTRIAYTLSGYFRGDVQGQAQVEWLRTGNRYQVRLDLSVGPTFAPLVSRRLVSDGELTEQGLAPRRYDEETKVAFRDARRQTIVFDGGVVRLPGGKELPAPPGVQDTASQFVQLTWLFTTQPALLEPGHTVALPLALPRYVDLWLYDVIARERLATPFGDVETVHVKPRRQPRPGVELTAELWVAPTLQYLPARILIRQDAETWIDLLITQLPLQAAPTGR